jgi:Phage tail assembly chaperone protein
MNNALISPQELIYSQDGTLLGERIAETSNNPFPVAEPLYWIECADEVNANDWYFDTATSTFQLKPLPPSQMINSYDQKLAVIIADRNARLAASDYTQLADNIAAHDAAWLTAWNTYRQALRDLPATITEANIDTVVWPTPPSA